MCIKNTIICIQTLFYSFIIMLKVHSSIAHNDYLLSSYSDSGQQMVHCAFIFTFVFAEAVRWQSSSSVIEVDNQPSL